LLTPSVREALLFPERNRQKYKHNLAKESLSSTSAVLAVVQIEPLGHETGLQAKRDGADFVRSNVTTTGSRVS
jgi:hypothetical protein